MASEGSSGESTLAFPGPNYGITTRGLVILVWWFMPLRGKVPRDSWWWCGFVRIKWGALAAVRCRDSGFNSDMLATAGVGPHGKVYQLTGMLPLP